jgi:hypothetical protein
MVIAGDMEARKSVGKIREMGASKKADGASEGSPPHRRDGDSAPPAVCDDSNWQGESKVRIRRFR